MMKQGLITHGSYNKARHYVLIQRRARASESSRLGKSERCWFPSDYWYGPPGKSQSYYSIYVSGHHRPMGHHRPSSETPFKWCFAGGPMVARFVNWVYSLRINGTDLLYPLSKPCQKLRPGPHHTGKAAIENALYNRRT